MLVMSKYLFVPYADGTMVHGCFTELTSFWSCLYINGVTTVFFFVPLVLLVLLYLVIGRSLMRDSASAALQHRKIDLPNMKARKQVREGGSAWVMASLSSVNILASSHTINFFSSPTHFCSHLL